MNRLRRAWQRLLDRLVWIWIYVRMVPRMLRAASQRVDRIVDEEAPRPPKPDTPTDPETTTQP